MYTALMSLMLLGLTLASAGMYLQAMASMRAEAAQHARAGRPRPRI